MTDEAPLTFDALGLSAELVSALATLGHEQATAVQVAVIPAALAGRDVKAQAQTGTGKTLAFGLPLLQLLAQAPRVKSARGNPVATLVLVPTRELAVQVAGVLGSLAEALASRPRVLAVYGGVSINPQMMSLRGGVDLLVATPGRLLDLKRNNAVDLSGTRALVLDEADRMLGLGFHDEVKELLALLPQKRQNLLFSATFPHELEPMMSELLSEPELVNLSPVVTPALIEQHVYTVDESRKAALLTHVILENGLGRVLVFISEKKTADRLVKQLLKANILAAAFHGGLSQNQRQTALDDFTAGHLHVLVATDLAARGIDIEDLPVVVNFELPRSPNDYAHRIGRTGRAGKPGLALSLICPAEYDHFRVIEKRIKRRLEREWVPGFEVLGSAP
jgi:ATP-dependent RNA helicase RhlE